MRERGLNASVRCWNVSVKGFIAQFSSPANCIFAAVSFITATRRVGDKEEGEKKASDSLRRKMKT